MNKFFKTFSLLSAAAVMMTSCGKSNKQDDEQTQRCTIDSTLQKKVETILGTQMDFLSGIPNDEDDEEVADTTEIEPMYGVAIVMETATGNIKALVNMEHRVGDSCSHVSKTNYAMTKCNEPGSLFKVASLLVALDDGEITPYTTVDTGSGVYMMHGHEMKDWGWATRGGFGLIDVREVLKQSSNIGVSRLVDEHYGKCPEKFVKGLQRVGIGADLEMNGCAKAIMKTNPNDTANWFTTTLAWMSIGYENLITPLHTCTFYNGLANHGKMMAPRLYDADMRDTSIVKTYEPKVLREHMASKKSLDEMYDMLENVVSESGTGKKGQCDGFRVCGKTGTAQMMPYDVPNPRYFISFCGFFPAENPKYTCFVGIYKNGLPASGGGHCGPVFKQIAESIMNNK